MGLHEALDEEHHRGADQVMMPRADAAAVVGVVELVPGTYALGGHDLVAPPDVWVFHVEIVELLDVALAVVVVRHVWQVHNARAT